MTRLTKYFIATLTIFSLYLTTAQSAYSITLQDSSRVIIIDGVKYMVAPIWRVKNADSMALQTKADSARIESLLTDLENCALSKEIMGEIIRELKQIGVLRVAQNEACEGKLAKSVKREAQAVKGRGNWRKIGLGSIILNTALILLL